MENITPTELAMAIDTLRERIDMGQPRDAALASADQLLAQAQALGDAALVARTQRERARAASLGGRPRQGAAIMQEAIRLLQRENRQDLLAWAHNEQAEMHYHAGDYHQALDAWLRCLELAGERDERQFCALAYIGIGKVYYAFDDYANALHFHRAAEQIARPLDQPLLSCGIQINIAGDAYRMHDHATAMTALGAAEAWLDQGIVRPVWRAEIVYYYGLIHFEQGDLEHAERFLNDAYRIYRDTNNQWGEGRVLLHLGRTYQKLGRPKAALECLQTANQIGESANLAQLRLQTEELLSQLFLDVGDYRQALVHHKRLHDAVTSRELKQGALRLPKQVVQQLRQVDLQLQLERVRLQQLAIHPSQHNT
ncbi:Tetratricopeptide repeat-containing protein [Andreprevotia lacus DSM 23236]|jgi:tetratricopeptide (TPR) repeat protein|uniref:Tetratricopeptide repeat-containing protein n=1 Tax=Andreprevotia lacus DSM 23236 TaxID=1121001 RepID=A0A1W1Y1B1_9NEIS|nr:tetratricopeptide repeat protein [Andreprevotia lacus]SMC29915.1 Tetratricopeptide repeat-containing protein [Andreprevotia lacus DSM 23236]